MNDLVDLVHSEVFENLINFDALVLVVPKGDTGDTTGAVMVKASEALVMGFLQCPCITTPEGYIGSTNLTLVRCSRLSMS